MDEYERLLAIQKINDYFESKKKQIYYEPNKIRRTRRRKIDMDKIPSTYDEKVLYRRQYYEANKEKIKAYMKEYYRKNKENKTYLKYHKQYYEDNKTLRGYYTDI